MTSAAGFQRDMKRSIGLEIENYWSFEQNMSAYKQLPHDHREGRSYQLIVGDVIAINQPDNE
ncbi:hypothetical protein NECAME_02905 [Necator americanus]|uniref:Uncharacterized protein n=1 Tax=Necator americanus TaxID=51031 RepID=W2T9C5_NECAM|nr:hypothetical protein NECAME_02905 [Necator americanus]ETN78468.1 hypothetical protein NECAME_02905 [Necator americanus]